MKKAVVKRLWSAHRVAGAFLGSVVFLLFLTGTICMFRDELRLWSSPAVQADGPFEAAALDAVSVQKAVQSFSRHHPLTETPRWAVLLPLYPQGVFELLYRPKDEPGLLRAYVRGGDFAYLGSSDRTPSEFLFNIHANLTIRQKTGRILVGCMGLVCLFLVITGLLIHRHKLRNAFSFRSGSSLRRSLGDAHRALGLWGVPFFALISLSGAALGLKTLLLLSPTAVVFKGDVAQAKRVLRHPSPQPANKAVSMQPVAALWKESLRHIAHAGEGESFVPTIINVQHWGDENARWSLSGSLRGSLSPQNEAAVVRLSAKTATLDSVESIHEQGWPQRIYSTLTPLHYGDFGGWPMKLLYAALGLSGLGLVATGLMIWAQRMDLSSRKKS